MDSLETMANALIAINQRYSQIEQSLAELKQSVAADGWSEKICEQINQELESIRTWGQQAWINYQTWPESQRTQPALRHHLNEITGHVTRCLQVVQELEKQAQQQRDQLLPHVHTGVQVLRMQQAYAAG